MEIKVILFTLVMLVICLRISSAVEIIDNPAVDPFSNNTNVTAIIEEPKNYSDAEIQRIIEEYLGNKTDIQVNDRMIQELINISQSNKDERAYMDAILKLSTKNQQDFTQALQKMDYALQNARKDRDQAISDKDEITKTFSTKQETQDTELESQRLEIAKLKGYSFFYVAIGLIIGILGIEFANYLKHNQHAYFVIRKIRDKIPIKF